MRSGASTVHYLADSVSITADLFIPAGSGNGAAVVLLHGASTYGRKLPIVQVLGRQFRGRGYTVLAPDLRGFGESENPSNTHHPDAFDFARDVEAAIDFLVSKRAIDSTRIHVVGHSFGAGVALAGQARDPRVRKVVLFGPPRRWNERLLRPGAPDRDYFVDRFARDMELDRPVTFEIVRNAVEPLNIENYVGSSGRPKNADLFLIDAEMEDPADISFLRAVYPEIPPPVSYWTVPDTDHYLSTGSVEGRAVYNRRVMRRFVERVDGWLSQ